MPRKKKLNTRRFTFVLTDAPRDQIIKEWLMEKPNASEAIKQLIYERATGQVITTGHVTHTPEEKEVHNDLDDPAVLALAEFEF